MSTPRPSSFHRLSRLAPRFCRPRAIVIDIGSSRVAIAVFGSTYDGRLVLRQCSTEPIVRIGGVDDTDWAARAGTAIEALARRTGLRGECRISLPGDAILLRTVRAPLTGARRIQGAVDFEAHRNLPQPLDQVVWDHVPIQVENGYCDALLAAARLRSAEQICRAVAKAGLQPTVLEPSAYSLLQGMRLGGGELLSGVVASIGARSTHLAFASGEKFCLRTLEIGGDDVAARTAESLGLSFADAEAEVVAAIASARPVPAAMRDAVAMVAERLRAEIGRFRLHVADLLRQENIPDRVEITGRAARLPGLVAALGRTTVARPVDLSNWQRLSVESTAIECGVISVELVGLATSLVDPVRPSLNLLPPEFLRSHRARNRRPAIIAAAAVVMVSPLPGIARFRSEAAALGEQAETASRRAEALTRMSVRRRQLESEMLVLEQRSLAIREADDRHRSMVALIGGIQASIAGMNGVWLEKLDPGTDDEITIELSGCTVAGAATTADVFRTLRASPRVGRLENESTMESSDGVRFECTVRMSTPGSP